MQTALKARRPVGRAQVIIGMSCRATRGTYASPLISASLHDNNLAFSWEESKEESSEKDGARGCFGFASGKVCRRARRLRQLLRNLLLHINCCHMLEGGHMYPHTVLEPTDMHAVSMPEDCQRSLSSDTAEDMHLSDPYNYLFRTVPTHRARSARHIIRLSANNARPAWQICCRGRLWVGRRPSHTWR